MTNEDRPVGVDPGPGGPFGQQLLERIIRTVQPGQIQRGEDHGLDLAEWIENRVAKIDGARAGNAAGLIVANGKGA